MKRKSGVVSGIILILLGVLFLISEIAPQYFQFFDWPIIIMGLGGIFIIWAILSDAGGLAIPGSILMGLGGIFFYQNSTGNWSSWSYIWALIPGFVGIGIIIDGLIRRNFKSGFTSGLILLLISATLLFAFGSAFGMQAQITQYWPVLLIGLGVISLVRAVTSSKHKGN